MATTECSTYFRPVLKAYSPAHKAILLYQPRCKMWKCPYCASVNSSYWCKKCADGVRQYQELGVVDWMFVTITNHRKVRTLAKSMYVWPSAWAKLSSRMRYHFPGIRYILIPEQHKDGTLHIHACASHGIDTRWLKDNAPYVGLGYMAEGEPLTDAVQAAIYAAKYLQKSTQDAQWPTSFRRIRTSQKWPEPTDCPEWEGLNLEWQYLSSYPAEGLEYLAQGIREKNKVDVQILK